MTYKNIKIVFKNHLKGKTCTMTYDLSKGKWYPLIITFSEIPYNITLINHRKWQIMASITI